MLNRRKGELRLDRKNVRIITEIDMSLRRDAKDTENGTPLLLEHGD